VRNLFDCACTVLGWETTGYLVGDDPIIQGVGIPQWHGSTSHFALVCQTMDYG
jgi:hypothetical protein